MRTVREQRKILADQIKVELDKTEGKLTPHDVFDIELALHLLANVAKRQNAYGAPALLDGHGGERLLGDAPPDAAVQISNVRVAIGRSVSMHRWHDLIRAYRRLPGRIRGFEFDDEDCPVRQTFCALAPNRFEVYDEVLTQPLAYATTKTATAGPGVHKIVSAYGRHTVEIPDDLPSVAASSRHPVIRRGQPDPISLAWDELTQTAVKMDRVDAEAGRSPSWERRIRDTELLVRSADNTFATAESITVTGLLHMVGMVSAGKTTLIQVVGVWAAMHGKQVTIILGDNAAVLDMVAILNRYVPDCAAPILGSRRREQHLSALHKRRPFEDGTLHVADSTGFEWLSTACALSALLPDGDRLNIAEAPCEDLVEYNELDKVNDRAWAEGPRRVCPLWHGCQRHHAARALIDAPIWVGTQWGLVYTLVPSPLTDQRLRYLEAAWRRSDLILVDEVDRVQTGMDEVFAAGQVLFGPGKEAWVDQIFTDVDNRLRTTRHAGRRHRKVRDFTEHLNAAKVLEGILYSLLQRDARHGGDTLASWMGPEFFTSWTLAEKMARELSGYDPRAEDLEEVSEPPGSYEVLRAGFHAYIDAPSQSPNEHTDRIAASVAGLNHYLLIQPDEDERAEQFQAWIRELADSGILTADIVTGLDIPASAMRLELLLAVALFTFHLTELRYDWPTVYRLLELTTSHPQQSPPDLRPLVPEAPMGTALGFQYLAPQSSPIDEGAGELHFFEATGIGRALLLDLPTMFRAEAPGPNVILLSGTSWAGTSPRYHVAQRVEAILKPSDEILAGIEKSTFEVLVQRDPRTGRAIRVSGKHGDARFDALRQLVGALVAPGSDGRSRLDKIQHGLSDSRKKILLIVGSYIEARVVHDALVRLRPGTRARYLLSDDADDDGWTGEIEALRRSKIADFGTSADEILIAPLLAVERGHNVLNRHRVAAIGAALFLVRPHPSPQDIAWVTQSLNSEAIQRRDSLKPLKLAPPPRFLENTARERRREAQQRWRALLRTELVYSRLANDPGTREQLIWTQIVTIWQVVGRLVRGGQDAKVYFCDAAFVPASTAQKPAHETADTSLLLGMRDVLDAYCSPGATSSDRYLVQALYGPLHQALVSLKGYR